MTGKKVMKKPLDWSTGCWLTDSCTTTVSTQKRSIGNLATWTSGTRKNYAKTIRTTWLRWCCSTTGAGKRNPWRNPVDSVAPLPTSEAPIGSLWRKIWCKSPWKSALDCLRPESCTDVSDWSKCGFLSSWQSHQKIQEIVRGSSSQWRSEGGLPATENR